MLSLLYTYILLTMQCPQDSILFVWRLHSFITLLYPCLKTSNFCAFWSDFPRDLELRLTLAPNIRIIFFRIELLRKICMRRTKQYKSTRSWIIIPDHIYNVRTATSFVQQISVLTTHKKCAGPCHAMRKGRFIHCFSASASSVWVAVDVHYENVWQICKYYIICTRPCNHETTIVKHCSNSCHSPSRYGSRRVATSWSSAARSAWTPSTRWRRCWGSATSWAARRSGSIRVGWVTIV